MKDQTQRTLKGIIAGTVIGATIALPTSYAAINTVTLEDVLMDGISIVVDGKKLNPTDANGKNVEPLIYNGTTYLPVRAVANSMGKAVYWDGPSYTVYLGKMDGKLEYPTVRIENMTSIDDQPAYTNRLTDNYDNQYSKAIYNGVYHTSVEYLTNMKYSRFKGTLYVPNGVYSDQSAFLTIEADGKIIYKSPVMTKISRPVDIDVNVTGYNDIKIQFSNSVGYESALHQLMLCLADAGFYQ